MKTARTPELAQLMEKGAHATPPTKENSTGNPTEETAIFSAGQNPALRDLAHQIQLSRYLATQAKADLEHATPLLIKAISASSGQGRKIERLLWSTWNGDHKVGLCDGLTGLDPNLAQAALALLAARAHLAGDADPLIRHIISESGSQPPRNLRQDENS